MQTYAPNKVLVTGGMGFIGSNFIHYLLASDPKVFIINLDLNTYAGSAKNLLDLPDSNRHRLIHGDICDRFIVSNILEEFNIDTIIHFAAETHVDRSIESPQIFSQTNIIGTHTLVEAAKNFWQKCNLIEESKCRFFHISTDEVFGCRTDLSQPSFVETDAYDPHSPYSASKAAGSHLVKSYYHTYKLPILISNCTNNYGPRQHLEKFIPKIIDSCMNRHPIPLYGDGSNIRDWLYVEDHCSAIKLILEEGIVGNEYNVSGNNELSNLEVVENICQIMNSYFPAGADHRNLIKFVADRPGHDWRYSLNSNKLSNNIGWSPRTKFTDGIMTTIKYYSQKQLASHHDFEAVP